jgi:hypothetical protein
MADETDDPQVPADPAGAHVPHPDPATGEDAHAGGDIADPAHGVADPAEIDPEAPGPSVHAEAAIAESDAESIWVDETADTHEADDHGHGHDAHDDHGQDAHGHDDHGAHGPADDAWVLAPILVGLVIGLIVAVVFGIASGASPFA